MNADWIFYPQAALAGGHGCVGATRISAPTSITNPSASLAPLFRFLARDAELGLPKPARAGRHEQIIGERLIADQAVLRALPELPFEPCDKRPAKVSSTALVRYRMNDYSAPTAYGFRDVLVSQGVGLKPLRICSFLARRNSLKTSAR
jgi:hypothetical protein